MLDRWIELSGTAVSRPEAMRRMLHLVVDGPRKWPGTTYGAPRADAAARIVSFWVENDGERFSVEVPWSTIEDTAKQRIAKRSERWSLAEEDEYAHFCEQWQSQLVAAAIGRFRAASTISLRATDLGNIIDY